MTVQQLIDTKMFQVINIGDDTSVEITKPFCCDLLSIAMGKAPSGSAGELLWGILTRSPLHLLRCRVYYSCRKR